MTVTPLVGKDEFMFGCLDDNKVVPITNGGVRIERNPGGSLESPHYSDMRFRKERTVYLKTGYGLVRGLRVDLVKDASYEYSDRLAERDFTRHKSAWEHAMANDLPDRSAHLYEAYLTAYFGEPVELLHVLVGVNVSNGYPYYIFGYRTVAK